MATHVGVLDQGRLVQFGTPREIYENPVVDLRRRPPRPAAHQHAARRPLRPAPPPARALDRPAPRADPPGRGRGQHRRRGSSASATRPGSTSPSAATTIVTVTDAAHRPSSPATPCRSARATPFYFDATGARVPSEADHMTQFINAREDHRHRGDRRTRSRSPAAGSRGSTAIRTSASSSAPTGTAPRSRSSPAAAPATSRRTQASSAAAC